jgi:hypothetical protein
VTGTSHFLNNNNLHRVDNYKELTAGKHNGILNRAVNKIIVITAIKWLEIKGYLVVCYCDTCPAGTHLAV